MAKFLTILGATGNQGGSIAKYVVSDPVLSKEYSVRAVTRDTQKPAAQALAALGMEVVKGDIDDIDSIKATFKGAHTVFAITTTVYDEQLKAREVRQGKALADAAIEAGYIRSLPIKSSFFAPSSFMQNYDRMVQPHHSGDGTFAITNVVRPDTKLPHIDIEGDTGKFVGAILAEPDKFEDFYSFEDVAQMLTRLTGKTVKYYQVPVELFKGFLPPHGAQCMAEMMLYSEDPGYYGSDSKEKVDWTVSVARGKLTTLEEYFAKHMPPALD
ncbi:hscarg dehydrogenase, putative [Talaromyces stipitatus ATCC 10500]|uniref:Hscarg dehydrogenase, putative n=1 Tax=Talaromyces stipitatus (strain ATCC 10500 / CBS 375.48 / QM 6759 / NRRL 1006) TaxID=441959 RepID=B8MGC1_TALSN|nr:hscarg dehydrogenase, putative [Talaromyces stipitatus ATCC 10500]EED16241.1 hscarg dehydrogenase, putative [Talaromyces stipitatus ATCC 10500]